MYGWILDLARPGADKVFHKMEKAGISNLFAADAAVVSWLCSSILMRGPISIEMMKAKAPQTFTDILSSGELPKELETLGKDAVELTRRHFPGLIQSIG